MRRIFLILPLLALLFAMAPDLSAQTVQNDSLHPNTYGWALRPPMHNGTLTTKITHTAAAAKVDTFAVTGLATTAKVLYTRLAPPKKAVSPPTITILANKVLVSFDVADTLTYCLQIDNKTK